MKGQSSKDLFGAQFLLIHAQLFYLLPDSFIYIILRMQNKKKQNKVKHIKKNRKSNGQTKFSKNQPAPRSAPETEQKKKIVTNNDKITKTINKNIEKTMMQRAVTGKEKFKFLK